MAEKRPTWRPSDTAKASAKADLTNGEVLPLIPLARKWKGSPASEK